MSWRTGASLFWEIWPKIQASIPDPEHRADFTRKMLTLFLDDDVDRAICGERTLRSTD